MFFSVMCVQMNSFILLYWLTDQKMCFRKIFSARYLLTPSTFKSSFNDIHKDICGTQCSTCILILEVGGGK